MLNWTTRGQVLEISGDHITALIHLSGLDDDIRSAWIPIPLAMPEWAKKANGPVFKAIANIDDATKLTFEYLKLNPGCLVDFSCKPIPKTTDWLFD